jgi:hypothetical protein
MANDEKSNDQQAGKKTADPPKSGQQKKSVSPNKTIQPRKLREGKEAR